MDLEKLEVYQLSMGIGEKVWGQVNKWNYFQKDTVGKQLVRSVDSIGANISEGYGRYSFKENKRFCYYSRGSLVESKTWLKKALNRNLVTPEFYESIIADLELLHKKLNGYIKSIGASSLN